jgi:hypothetical protein
MRIRSLLLSTALLVLPLPLMADTFDLFELTNVTFASGAFAVGSVDIDINTGVADAWNVGYDNKGVVELFVTPSFSEPVPGETLFILSSTAPNKDDFDFNIGIANGIGYLGGPVCSIVSPCTTPEGRDTGAFIPGSGGFLDSMETGSLDLSASYSTSPVPEPSSLMLLGTGILGAAGMLRRRLFA